MRPTSDHGVEEVVGVLEMWTDKQEVIHLTNQEVI